MRRLLAAFTVAQVADAATTLYGLHHGATELNPLGVRLLAVPAVAVGAKLLAAPVALGLVMMYRRLPLDSERRAAGETRIRRAILRLALIVAIVAAWNVLQTA